MAEQTQPQESLHDTVQRALQPHVARMIRDGLDNDTIVRLTGARPEAVEKQRRLIQANK